MTILLLISFSAFAGTAFAAAPDGAIVVSGNTFADIQAAIDAADDGGTVYIPDGVYFMASEDDHLRIINKTNLTLLGESKDGAILKVAEGYDDEESFTMILIEDSPGFTMQYLQVDGSNSWHFYNGIYARRSDNIKFNNLIIHSLAYNDDEEMPDGEEPSGIFVSRCNGVDIRDNYIYNIAGLIDRANDLIAGGRNIVDDRVGQRMWGSLESAGNEIESAKYNIFTGNYTYQGNCSVSISNLGKKEYQ